MNRAIIGLLDYGRRSEGKHHRLGKDGPRILEESDRNEQNRGKPKRIFNDPSVIITSPLPSDPRYFDPGRWEAIQTETIKRSRNQRGLPRNRDPGRYPLACRVIDLTNGCGHLMYAHKHGQRSVYTCGKYMATGGSDCENNTVDGEAILRFTLETLWELTDRLGAREKLRRKLLERAEREQPENPLKSHYERERLRLQQQVEELRRHFEAARRNLAIEENPEHRQVIAEEFDRIKAELADGEKQLAAVPSEPASSIGTPEEEVEAALSLLDDVRRIASDPASRAQVLSMAQKLELWIGLQFAEGIKGKKRRVRRLAGGVLAFGAMPVPNGTAGSLGAPSQGAGDDSVWRQGANDCENGQIASNSKKASGGRLLLPEAPVRESCPQEGVSFTKGSRGDWI
jgi:hypothetical protein